MKLELTIIVPAFNEANRLSEGMRRFQAAVADGAVDLDRTEVLLIDDGSTDQTAATARSLLADLPHHQVISLPGNAGKGAAVRTGVSLARGAYTAYMDADMAIDPRAIPQLLDALRTSDLAIGSRALPDSMVDGTYAVRAVMGRLFNRLVTAGTGLGLLDTQCGFKSFRTPAARLLFHLVRIDRFAFDVEVLARARRLGLRITEIPVQWKHVAGSTIHPLQDPLSMLADVYRSRFGLLATPPVPAISVVDSSGDHRDSDLGDEVRSVVARSLDGEPVPVVGGSSSAMVLLPLVDAAATAEVLSALRAEFEPMSVYRRSLSLESLVALGALAGRLQAPPAPGGTA